MSNFENKSASQGSELEDELISKTQLKKDALALKKFGLELSQLPVEKVKALPIDDTTKESILDYQKITTNLAKKRQLMFVGKCLRNEDEELIRQFLSEQANSHLKTKVVKADPLIDCIEKLLLGNPDDVEELLQQYSNLERQTFRQLIRNISNAKKAEKINQATEKLKLYLKENTSLGNK
jgi:ribosome-associated protein